MPHVITPTQPVAAAMLPTPLPAPTSPVRAVFWPRQGPAPYATLPYRTARHSHCANVIPGTRFEMALEVASHPTLLTMTRWFGERNLHALSNRPKLHSIEEVLHSRFFAIVLDGERDYIGHAAHVCQSIYRNFSV
ncbi:MAG: hypothetical protein GAK34_02169 [Delftia tsuruhatensis]|nr:MAG: hypothetical protein GAK34_02169 [Delftia tsuruhatensis]